jgi:predicted enzyme related to lactoylglutathione lyase
MNEEAVYWNPLVPELTVTRIEDSLRFYAAAGFTVRFRRQDPPFAYIELGQVQFMLEEESPDGWAVATLDRPLGRGVNFQIEVDDADATCSALQRAGYKLFEGLQENWYSTEPGSLEGQREFLVQDPDGYLLRFAQYLGTREDMS